MPSFSDESLAKLSECHPELQLLFHKVVEIFDCTVTCGHRNQADQEAAFASGNTKLHYPNGKHNAIPSLAVDVAPFPVDYSNTKRFYWFGGYVLGVADQLFEQGIMMYRIRFGGDWDHRYDLNDPKMLNDLVHFELIL